jgi:hypothetical protein
MTADPAWGKRMMDGIQEISDAAQALLTDTSNDRADFVAGLSVSLLNPGVTAADLLAASPRPKPRVPG